MQNSFVFYRSFLSAIQEMEEADQLAMFWAICNYALTGEEPVLQSAIQRAVFAVIRPSIDTNIAKREGGKRGGRPKAKNEKTTVSKPETIGFEDKNLPEQGFSSENQESRRFSEPESTVTEAEAVTAAEAVFSKDPDSRTDTALAGLIQDYHQEIGSFPRSALDKLQAYRAAVA